MKLYLKGSGTEINLDQRDFIAKGGEGSIFGKGAIAYKVYDDPHKMIPVAKIGELAVLDHPNIIKPDVVLLDGKNKPIGYTMRLLNNTHVLVSLFTKAFRLRNGIDDAMMLHLVRELQKLVAFVHSKRILIVDLNEMNFLTDAGFKDIYGIDVNSYQTPGFPATAIMDTIRDRHMTGHNFNQNTDWFSWAVVAFQMLIGIHPYKGSHPDFETMPKDERLNARMTRNVSVFHKNATWPKVCQPFDVIPPTLKGWFVDVFERGHRGNPPPNYAAVVVAVATAIQDIVGTDLFDIQELQTFAEEIVRVCSTANTTVVFTKDNLVIGKKLYPLPSPTCKIAFAPKTENPIAFWIDNGLKALDVVSNKPLSVPATGTALLECDGRVYVQNGTYLMEFMIGEFPTGVKILPKQVGKVMDVLGATQIYDGVILQNVLGTFYATIFPVSGQSHQVKLTELSKYQIIDVKYENGVLVVVGTKLVSKRSMATKSKYDRFVFRMSPDYKNYDFWTAEDVTYTGINFTVADHGVAVLMNEEEKLEAFSETKGSSTTPKRFDDDALDTDMKLCHRGSKILFAKGKKLYSISMK